MAGAFSSRGGHFLRAVAAGALLSLRGADPHAGQEATLPPEKEVEERRLEEVRQEIQLLKSELERVRSEENTLLGELQRLDLELALHRRQLQLLDAGLSRCRREIAESSSRVTRLRERLVEGRRILGARLKAMYIAGAPVPERLALTARRPAEVVEAYRVASWLSQVDGERVRTYRSDLASLEAALVELEARRKELISLRSQETVRRRELEAIRSHRARLLTDVRQEAEERQGALREMMETERALHRLVEALSAGSSVPPEWRIGFEKFRGLLPWPVPGKILVPFGVRKNSRFETQVPHPGIDLSVKPGQPIRAIFDGRVAFSDWFKGYGNLVILEHGGGFMTVYAHASERLVAAGDRVASGQTIARAGDTGSLEGPKLYFQIWREGKPEDPVGWLARRSK